jgi:hypothetical protein
MGEVARSFSAGKVTTFLTDKQKKEKRFHFYSKIDVAYGESHEQTDNPGNFHEQTGSTPQKHR